MNVLDGCKTLSDNENDSHYHVYRSTMPKSLLCTLILTACLSAVPSMACAQDAEFKLVLRNHKFEPAELVVPAGRKIKLVINNLDPTPEEFESYELNREKIIPGNATITVYVGPLKEGRYQFFGDFNKDTAQGVLVAK